MDGPENSIIWNMTAKCNFRCEYCYFPHDNTPVTETLPLGGSRTSWTARANPGWWD